MVQLKIIKGGKPGARICTPRLKLFSAFSVVDDYQGKDRVKFNWVRTERERPAAPYERLIDGYCKLDERIRPYFEDYVRELFTAEEIKAMMSFAQTAYNLEVHATEQPLPVSGLFMPMPFRHAPSGEGRGFHYPSSAEAKLLPFPVCAYFDLRNCPPSLSIQKEIKKRGRTFVEEILKILGIGSGTQPEKLEAAVERVYDTMGLCVERGKTRDERVRERSKLLPPPQEPAPADQ